MSYQLSELLHFVKVRSLGLIIVEGNSLVFLGGEVASLSGERRGGLESVDQELHLLHQLISKILVGL